MLIGEKTYLTCVQASSLEKLREWRNNPKIKQFMREYREINEEMQKKWFETSAHNDKFQLHFEIWTKEPPLHTQEKSKLIGHCSLTKINWTYRSAEFGVLIGDEDSHGQGLGSDALNTLIGHGFLQLNLHKVIGEVFSYNERALSAFYALGFSKECILRSAKFFDGKYHDVILISILEDEWKKLQEKK